GHAPCDLVLQHDVQVAQAWTQVEESAQERARHVVREVADEARAHRRQRVEVDAQRVPAHDANVRGRTLAEAGGERSVELYRDDLAGAGGQGKSERPRPRPDLEEHVSLARIDHAKQALDGRGAEEMLAQAAGHAWRLCGVRAGKPPRVGPRARSSGLW